MDKTSCLPRILCSV